MATNMNRTTVSFTDELTDRIFSLRTDARFRRCSYSELIRRLTELGLKTLEREGFPLQSEAAAAGGPARAEPERESA